MADTPSQRARELMDKTSHEEGCGPIGPCLCNARYRAIDTAYAQGRADERHAVVEWLWSGAGGWKTTACAADAIARGDHRGENK